MSQQHHGFFLPFDLHQDLIEFLGDQPIRMRRIARLHDALLGLPRGHIPAPNSAPNSAPAPLPTIVTGDTDDDQPTPSLVHKRL